LGKLHDNIKLTNQQGLWIKPKYKPIFQ